VLVSHQQGIANPRAGFVTFFVGRDARIARLGMSGNQDEILCTPEEA
jgi:hypothetical protein